MSVSRHGQKLCVCYPVRSFQVDANGHLNNAEYLHLLEAARDDFLAELGVGVPALLSAGVQLVISALQVRFLRPALFGDQIEIWGWMRELSRVRCTWIHEIRRAGELLTEAEVSIACLHARGHVIRIPPHLHAALQTILIPDAPASGSATSSSILRQPA